MNATEKLIVKKAVRAHEAYLRYIEIEPRDNAMNEHGKKMRLQAFYELVKDLGLEVEYNKLLKDKTATGD